MKKIRDFNFGYLVDLSVIAFFLAGFLMKTKVIPQEKNILAIILVSFIVFVLIYMFGQDTKITNKSEAMAFIKTEENEKVEELPQNSTKYGIDGVKINGDIYKTPDGTHATIKKNGKLKIHSITGYLLYIVLGGHEEPKDLPSDWDALKQKQ
jgi:Ca2+/Na+ antiporter